MRKESSLVQPLRTNVLYKVLSPKTPEHYVLFHAASGRAARKQIASHRSMPVPASAVRDCHHRTTSLVDACRQTLAVRRTGVPSVRTNRRFFKREPHGTDRVLNPKKNSRGGRTAMSCGLAEQFEVYARCCQKLAEEAGTPELRDRLLQMAQDFMWATTRTTPEGLRERSPEGLRERPLTQRRSLASQR
jgi:hypothetical protein